MSDRGACLQESDGDSCQVGWGNDTYMQHEETLSLDEPLIDHRTDRGCEEPQLP